VWDPCVGSVSVPAPLGARHGSGEIPVVVLGSPVLCLVSCVVSGVWCRVWRQLRVCIGPRYEPRYRRGNAHGKRFSVQGLYFVYPFLRFVECTRYPCGCLVCVSRVSHRREGRRWRSGRAGISVGIERDVCPE